MQTVTQEMDPATQVRQTLQHLLTRAQQGDRSVLIELRRVLDQDRSLWIEFGNLALQAEAGLVKLAAGNDLLLAESIMRKQADLKIELAGGDTDPLIKALAERAAICHLQVAYFDGLLSGRPGSSVAMLEPLRKQMDSANKRYLNAIKTLATVRKLLRPSVSPVAIASRLEARRPAVRESRVAVGTSVDN
ncbi:MAG: hypothetical protein JNM56_02435 [Planctomycetia bacterium]|nr:hypothetical protein [Planctomycetia bacterium]